MGEYGWGDGVVRQVDEACGAETVKDGLSSLETLAGGAG